jgi:coenzyme PQQ synthesis protein D (PqqD)
MNLTDSFSVPKHVMARNVGDETVILDLESGVYFGLDSVGARVWQLLAAGVTLEVICKTLLDQYEVTQAQLETDVVNLAKELLQRKLIQPI